jgi:UDP-N-acetyl-D-glucosamine dehydrogenase
MNDTAQELLRKIESRQATVGILGLGYVGLPLALAFSKAGFPVLGFDVDDRKVDDLNQGESYITHIDGSAVREAASGGRLSATADFSRLDEPDVLVICVPTPLTTQREPDMTYVVNTAEEIAKSLRRGQLVALESTTYPGTTEELLREILETSGLACGEAFFLAYSPEREDPGNQDFATTTIPKVVGGIDEISTDLAVALYSPVVVDTVRVSSARTAEAAKLLENIFRAVNIALVNELKIVYDEMDIDIWEVLDAAATKPFGFMRFNPGPGWGGHCIPIDPFYLSWKARQYGITTRFIELAGEVNIRMPQRVVEKLQEGLNVQGKPVKDSKVLILGLAYKKDVADPRESPAFEILSQLFELGAEVSYHDPFIPVAPSMRSWKHLGELESKPLTKEVLASQDAVVLVTDHTDVDYDFVLEHAPLVIDTRGVYRQPGPKVIRA